MKKILIIPVLFLTACASPETIVTTTKYQVITPNAGMYNCPTIRAFPDPLTLSDIQVAQLIVQLYENNQTCKNSIEAIKKFLQDAKARIERG